MAVFDAWDPAIVVFLVLVFAEYTKIRAKANKQFNWIAIGGLVGLLAAATPWIGLIGGMADTVGSFFGVIAYLCLLVGVILGALELSKAK